MHCQSREPTRKKNEDESNSLPSSKTILEKKDKPAKKKTKSNNPDGILDPTKKKGKSMTNDYIPELKKKKLKGKE